MVHQFSEASGGGPSQLLPIHLKEALACGCDLTEQKLVRALRRFVDLCASGSLPPELSEFVTAANLIPLKKKSGPKDVRPIACGEVLRRLVEKVILRKHLPAVKTHLEPEQVGVGIRDAATQTAIACSQLLPKLVQQPKMGLLQIDLKNAFNSVLRAAVLRQVQQKAPHIFQWAKWSLGGSIAKANARGQMPGGNAQGKCSVLFCFLVRSIFFVLFFHYVNKTTWTGMGPFYRTWRRKARFDIQSAV